MTRTRLVSFAGSTIAVRCGDDESAALAEYLYRGLPDAGAAEACVELSLRREAGSACFVVAQGDEIIYRGECRGTAAVMLLERSLYHLADGSRGGLLFHAACVARGDRGVILPGPTGAGKTSLAAWLAAHSFDYLSDELVYVPDGSTRVEAFKRPLNVKTRGRAALAALVDFEDESVVPTGEGFLVSPALLSAGETVAVATAELLVFPQYSAGAVQDFEPLSPARAAMRLMGTLVNARSLPGHGFAGASELARSTPAYALTYGTFEGIEARIAALIEGGER